MHAVNDHYFSSEILLIDKLCVDVQLSDGIWYAKWYHTSVSKCNVPSSVICISVISDDLLICTAFHPWDSSPHLPVTPAQLMSPGIGQSVSCTVDDFAQHAAILLWRRGLMTTNYHMDKASQLTMYFSCRRHQFSSSICISKSH